MLQIPKIEAEIILSCAKCNGTGFIAPKQECECLWVFRKKALAVLSRIPSEYLDLDLESYPGVVLADSVPNKEVIDRKIKSLVGMLKNYLNGMTKENAQGIIFAGGYGIGKTALAAICMKHAMNVF